MTISPEELKKIADLAYLDFDEQQQSQLMAEISSIMDLVDQLRSVDTGSVIPLSHPLALHQRLRTDEVTEEACIAELEAMAPLFENDMYLVPKVIDADKS